MFLSFLVLLSKKFHCWHQHHSLTVDVSSVVGASKEMWSPDGIGRDSWDGGGHPLGREHDSTLQSGVEAPRLLKRSLHQIVLLLLLLLPLSLSLSLSLSLCDRCESTHGSVMKVHKGGSQAVSPSLALSPLSRLSLFSCRSTTTRSLFQRALSVHTALTCPQGHSACTLAHSLSGELVRIMQETFVQVFLVHASCHLERSGPASVVDMERCSK